MATQRWTTLYRNTEGHIDRAVLKRTPSYIRVYVQSGGARYHFEIYNLFTGEWARSRDTWRSIGSAKRHAELVAQDSAALRRWFPNCALTAHLNWASKRIWRQVTFEAKGRQETIGTSEYGHGAYYVIEQRFTHRSDKDVVAFASNSIVACAKFRRRQIDGKRYVIVRADGTRAD